jgi:hypothetical protein
VVDPADIPRILLDAARLVRSGEIVVFGSGALAFSLDDAAPTTRDIHISVEPIDRGELVEAVMGERSWYHDKHGAYVEVWQPETFAAPTSWRRRARVLTDETVPDVRLVVPHPHDVLLSKLERWSEGDRQHARQILAREPMSNASRDARLDEMPYRTGAIRAPDRVAAFEGHVQEWLAENTAT